MVDGLVSVARVPTPGAYVQLIQRSEQGWAWDTRTDADGRYSIAVPADESLCLCVVLPRALNRRYPRCEQFDAGPNQADIDLKPGALEIVIMPIDGPIHNTQVLLVVGGLSLGVTVTSPIEGRVVDLPYGRHEVKLTTMDYQHTFDSAEAVITEQQPTARLTLRAPYSR